MKIASDLYDSRINARNILVEATIEEYRDLVSEVLQKNEFQRKRVRSSKSVYALLKEDLLRECIIPPIVLALTKTIDFDKGGDEEFEDAIRDNKDYLVILDGLQRTYTIIDLLEELQSSSDEEAIKRVKATKLRIEIYVGLNRLGILYRMLTLNTGQTPMSLRQQIEMLYLDYLKQDIDGIELIREAEGRVATRPNQYNFKDVVEGFNAYLDRDELPIDKANVLENISSLEKLSKEDQSSELFEKYLMSLHKHLEKINDLCGGSEISEEYKEKNGTPFGKTASQIFKKPQAISGFGAAIGKLIDFSALENIEDVGKSIQHIEIDDPDEFLEELNDALLWLKDNSKKIGNAQRSFFTFYFRDLFNDENDSYADPIKAAKSALRKYQAQNM